MMTEDEYLVHLLVANSIRLNEDGYVDIRKYIKAMNMKLAFYTCGAYGLIFKMIKDDQVKFIMKIIPYYMSDQYKKAKPEDTEYKILKLLNETAKINEYVVKSYVTFVSKIKKFLKHFFEYIDNDIKNYYCNYHRYSDGIKNYHDKARIIITKYYKKGDLLKQLKYGNITNDEIKNIIFQVIYALAIIQQKHKTFRHNSLKANDILLEETDNKNKYITHEIKGTKFILPNINLQIKLWDFDFSCIGGLVDNHKVDSEWASRLGIKKNKNRYYDMYYFLNTLRVFAERLHKYKLSNDIHDFIKYVIPNKYPTNAKKCRCTHNDEFMTPLDVLINSDFFDEYRLSGDKMAIITMLAFRKRKDNIISQVPRRVLLYLLKFVNSKY